MNRYELITIFDPELGEDKIKEVVAKVENKVKGLGAEVEKTDLWGSRKLNSIFQKAKKLKYGYYVMQKINGPSSLPQELTHYLKVTENVIRYSVARAQEEALLPISEPAELEIPPAEGTIG